MDVPLAQECLIVKMTSMPQGVVKRQVRKPKEVQEKHGKVHNESSIQKRPNDTS